MGVTLRNRRDLDGDGDLDLVTANSNGNSVSMLLGNAAWELRCPAVFTSDARRALTLARPRNATTRAINRMTDT